MNFNLLESKQVDQIGNQKGLYNATIPAEYNLPYPFTISFVMWRKCGLFKSFSNKRFPFSFKHIKTQFFEIFPLYTVIHAGDIYS